MKLIDLSGSVVPVRTDWTLFQPQDQAGSRGKQGRQGRGIRERKGLNTGYCLQPTFYIAARGSSCLSKIKEMEATGERFRSDVIAVIIREMSTSNITMLGKFWRPLESTLQFCVSV